MNIKNKERDRVKAVFICIGVFFGAFLLLPLGCIFVKSISCETGVTLEFYKNIIIKNNFKQVFFNSIFISALGAFITTTIAFFIAYTINYTNIDQRLKRVIKIITIMPMLLPTITYGFAIIYSFGKQGLLTLLFGKQLFEIYGINGLLIGYVIYTLPISFLLINNAMAYIDKKFMLVSRAMGDKSYRSFLYTVIRPLLGTLAASFIQSFTLSFTDYGIPASVGGNIELLSTTLYNEMLGSIPNFNTGSVAAVMMLIPSVGSFLLLTYIDRYNIRYNKISNVEIPKNKGRDIVFMILSLGILITVSAVFFVILVVPFVEQWPYRIVFSLEHVKAVFLDNTLMSIYKNSLWIAFLTSIFGTISVYAAAFISARNVLGKTYGKAADLISVLANTVPGMVLGVGYLLTFKGTFIQNTFFILVVCNMVHFFSSPYLMIKNSLEKLNLSWETTAKLMGDNLLKTIIRIIIPNTFKTIIEVFSYYFINAMVTVSAVIFIAGAKTMVVTAKIKELQHFSNFNEIFVLSILILFTNLVVKYIFTVLSNKKNTKGDMI